MFNSSQVGVTDSLASGKICEQKKLFPEQTFRFSLYSPGRHKYRYKLKAVNTNES